MNAVATFATEDAIGPDRDGRRAAGRGSSEAVMGIRSEK